MNLTAKIICGIVSIIICTFLGYKFSEKYKLRREFMNGLFNFNKKMIDEVTFSRNSILNIIKHSNFDNQFNKFLENYMKNIGSDSIDFSSFWYLNDDEKDFINEFFINLGKSDAKTELNNLNLSLGKIKNYSEISLKEEKSYKLLYIKLGFLLGLLIFIILI